MYDKIKNFIRQSQILFMKIEMNVLSTLYVQYQFKIIEYEIRRKHFEDLSRTCNEL